jgi:hypothetical protein
MLNARTPRIALVAATVAVFCLAGAGPQAQAPEAKSALNWEMAKGGDTDRILPLRERARLQKEILEWRLDNILPAIMRREGVEMWLVVTFEDDRRRSASTTRRTPTITTGSPTGTASRPSTRRSSSRRSTGSTSIASCRPGRWPWAGTRRAARAS